MQPTFLKLKNIKTCYFVGILFLFCSLIGCGGGNDPVKKLQRQLQGEPEYAVVLNDMKEEGNFFPNYYHQYRIDRGEEPEVRPFQMVTDSYYKRYQPYLGMVVASKTSDGKVTNTPFPNGYQYVGNTQYGHWRSDSSGGSFWEFYGKYRMFTDVLGWAGGGMYRRDYNTFYSHYGSNRPYFGSRNQYGTNGTVTRKQKPDFYARKASRKSRSQSRFSDKVSRRMGRSKNTFRSRGFRFGK